MSLKSFEHDPTLNSNGVRVQFSRKGAIPATTPGSPDHVVNDGGSIRPIKDQKGWQVRCDQVGVHGGYEFSFGGNFSRSMVAGEVNKIDFTIDQPVVIRIEHIGMVSPDWGAIVVTRLY